MGKRPTISDVAVAAGVSTGTASKALNGVGRLHPETRQAVLDAAAALGFIHRQRGGSVMGSRSYTVGLLTTDSFSRFASPIMLGVEDALGAGQISVLLADGRGDAIREQHHVQTFLARRVDAIIVTGRRSEPRPPIGKNLPVPVCYVLSRSQRCEDLSIVIDDEQGARLAISHLVSLGRKRVAYVTGPEKHLSARLRQSGTVAELRKHGLKPVEHPAVWGEWSEAWGRQAAGILQRSGAVFDAVFCGSDQIARGMVEQLQYLGRRVPEDVSVVGFDDWDVIALASRPALTTVDPQLADLGRIAAGLILRSLAGERLSGLAKHDCRLVVRDSTSLVAE
ncbi:MAG: LacI family transcriptional regulator [Propionibacteriaceae bacterium]|jgi:LacI family transcriptional regulator|nr:LacI family transcriptional regulator [Propionibacteriaceae bacterium]